MLVRDSLLVIKLWLVVSSAQMEPQCKHTHTHTHTQTRKNKTDRSIDKGLRRLRTKWSFQKPRLWRSILQNTLFKKTIPHPNKTASHNTSCCRLWLTVSSRAL